MSDKSHIAIIVTVVVLTAALLVSVTATITLQVISNKMNLTVITDDDPEDGYDARYARLDEVYDRLMNEYYIELDEHTLIQGAIDGMMESVGDPFTFYYTPEEMARTNSDRVGHYVGIGIQVTCNDEGQIVIIRVFAAGPSKEAGLLSGDIILSADGIELQAFTSDELTEAVSHIKGEQGTYVSLIIKRGDELIETKVLRDNVISERVYYGMLDESIGYIELTEFFGDAVSEMENAVEKLSEEGAEAIIFDLRGNGGGQLDICLDILDIFLSDSLIVYTENRAGERQYYYSDDEKNDIPLAVLIDENSASASEITASALSENERAVLFGSTSYGKGIVQSLYVFPGDGAGMQLTTSAYYTPKGNSIHQVGVMPDYAVESGEVRFSMANESGTYEEDTVVMAALNYLKNNTRNDEAAEN